MHEERIGRFHGTSYSTSIENGNWVEYNPIASIADGSPIEFTVSGSGQDYLDAANTQLYVKAKITRADGADIAGDAQVGPVNLFLHSLFSDVDVSLNKTPVTSSNNTYAYRAYIETLLSYGSTAKQSQLTSQLYYKDVAGALEEINPYDDNAVNAGFVARSQFTNVSRVVDMIGKIHSDLFFQDKYMLNDVGVRIRLNRNKDSFCLMGAADATFKVKILDCKLSVRKVKISPSVFIAHNKALEGGNAKYPIQRAVCKTYTIPTGNLDHTQENLFTEQLPTRIVVGCVDNDAFNGRFSKNPFNFKHFDSHSTERLFGRSTTLAHTYRAQFQYKQLHNSILEPVCWDWKIDERRRNRYKTRGFRRWICTLRFRPDC